MLGRNDIYRLCVAPLGYVTPIGSLPGLSSAGIKIPYWSEAQLDALLKRSRSQGELLNVIRNTREMTEAFKPMINPYVPNFVEIEHRRCGPPIDEPEPEFMDFELKSYFEEIRFVPYGQTVTGYILRLGDTLHVTEVRDQPIIDLLDNENPKAVKLSPLKSINLNTSEKCELVTEGGKTYYDLPPYTEVRASSLEDVNLPDNIQAVCYGFSPYHQAGLVVSVDEVAAGHRGKVGMRLYNPTDCHIRLYIGEGCFMLNFNEYKCLGFTQYLTSDHTTSGHSSSIQTPPAS